MMTAELVGSVALETLLELLDSKQFTVKEAVTLIRQAQEQRSRLLREVLDLNVRVERLNSNHTALMDAVSDIAEKNAALRKTVVKLGGTV